MNRIAFTPYIRQIAASFSRARGDAFATVDRRITYAEAAAITQGMISGLSDIGIRRGDHLALLAGNEPRAVLAQVAVYSLGCRLVLVPPELVGVELAAFLHETETTLLLTDSAFSHNVSSLPTGVNFRLVESFEPADPSGGVIQVGTDERCATFRYTGGTWGRPKVVVSSPAYYLASKLSSSASIGTQERRLICASVTHGSGHLGALQTLASGDTIVLIGEFQASVALQTMREARVTSLILNPPMLYQLVDHPLSDAAWPELRDILHTGTWASPARVAQAIHRFGPIIRQIYGMTETGGITELRPHEHDPASLDTLSRCGKPMPGVEVQLRRQDKSPSRAGAVGEVVVRGPKVMTGYWKNGQIDQSILADGWFKTQDLGYWDTAGYLHLVGRDREVAVTGVGSDNVYLVILEEFLREHAGFRDAAAILTRDDAYGESVYCFIVADASAGRFSADQLSATIRQKLGSLYVPRGFRLVDALPRSSAGKVDKKRLSDLLGLTG